MSNPELMPLLTIVTVTLNAEKYFERTAESVQKVKDSSVQWIIIDGESKDGTHRLIDAVRHLVDDLIIEPDCGIFDAMNKAREKVKGRYVLFLNAGDLLINGKKVLNDLDQAPTNDTTVLLGHTVLYNNKKRYLKRVDLKYHKKMCWDMPYIHQSIYFPRNVIDKMNWYDIKYKVVSDFDLLLRMIKSDVPFQALGYETSEFFTGDFNWKNQTDSLSEKYNMLKIHYAGTNAIIKVQYTVAYVKAFLIRKVFNTKLYLLYRHLRYG